MRCKALHSDEDKKSKTNTILDFWLFFLLEAQEVTPFIVPVIGKTGSGIHPLFYLTIHYNVTKHIRAFISYIIL
jgi:hypothetical protein